MLEAVDVALPPAAGGVDDEDGRIEAGGRAADVLLDVERGVERRAEVFDPFHEVVHVNVIGMHVDVPEALHERRHRLDGVVHPPLEDALIAHDDAPIGERVHRVFGDAGDLVRVIEVGVEDDLLVELAPLLDDADERVPPGDVGQ